MRKLKMIAAHYFIEWCSLLHVRCDWASLLKHEMLVEGRIGDLAWTSIDLNERSNMDL